MARIPRMVITGEPAVYHVMSRTALPGLPLGPSEKDRLVNLIRSMSRLFFTEIIGFCVMGNHFHILVKMLPDHLFSDDEIRERFENHYGPDKVFLASEIPFYRKKWANLSDFIKAIKVGFSRYYNKRHDRKGYFWGDRFKSVIVETGTASMHCLAYIDLNPVRAGIVKRPEEYRWNSIGHHVQTGNSDQFLSLDFGFHDLRGSDPKTRFIRYRRFLYETGAIESEKGAAIDQNILEEERNRDFHISRSARFKNKTRYFSDSGIIGSRKFIQEHYQRFRDLLPSKRKKIPVLISGLDGIYSLKRLNE